MKFKKGDKVVLLNDVWYNQYVMKKDMVYTVFDFLNNNELKLYCSKSNEELKFNLFNVYFYQVRKRTIKEIINRLLKHA